MVRLSGGSTSTNTVASTTPTTTLSGQVTVMVLLLVLGVTPHRVLSSPPSYRSLNPSPSSSSSSFSSRRHHQSLSGPHATPEVTIDSGGHSGLRHTNDVVSGGSWAKSSAERHGDARHMTSQEDGRRGHVMRFKDGDEEEVGGGPVVAHPSVALYTLLQMWDNGKNGLPKGVHYQVDTGRNTLTEGRQKKSSVSWLVAAAVRMCQKYPASCLKSKDLQHT